MTVAVVADVVVVGAGAMGSAAAWWLARRGHDVVVLERFEQGHERGSSHGSTRIFRLAYAEPDYVRLAMAALPLWRELEDDAGERLLDTTGGVDHGDPKSVDAIEAGLAAAGCMSERLAAADAQERWPGLRFAGPVLFQPDAGRARADATVAALQRRAAHHGAQLRFETPAELTAVEDDAVVVRTPDGEVRARCAVVAAGAWLQEVAGGTFKGIPPTVVTQEQVFHFPTAPDAVADVEDWPSFIHYRTPAVYGLGAPGEGVKVAEHHTGAVTTGDDRSFELDKDGRERVKRYVSSGLPGLDPEPASATTCLYTNTPDHDFVIDRVGPVVVAGGFSGHGFKFTPLVGRMVADLVEGGALGAAETRRFACGRGTRNRSPSRSSTEP